MSTLPAWPRVGISVDLVPYSQQLTVLLNAVDCFPQGGLYSGVYPIEAARRYEQLWLPMMAACKHVRDAANLVPPLDIAYAWLVHRLNPVAYAKDLNSLLGTEAATRLLEMPPGHLGPFAFTDGDLNVGGVYRSMLHLTLKRYTFWCNSKQRRAAELHKKAEPFFPPKPLSQLEEDHAPGSTTYISALSFDLPAAMGRQGAFLHSILRPCYLEAPFLNAAQERYLNFIQLHREQPHLTLVPMLDIDLMWHTHMGLAASYRADMMSAFGGKLFNHDDDIQEGVRSSSFEATKAAYEERFPGAGPYNPPPTQMIPLHIRHPIELFLGNILQLFLAPNRRSSIKSLGTGSALEAGCSMSGPGTPPQTEAKPALTFAGIVLRLASGGGHTGGHAVFFAWLMSRVAAKVMGSKWNKLFKSEDTRKIASIQKTIQEGLGFSTFRNLPLSMVHPYWQLFQIRDSTAWGVHATQPQPRQQGLALGLPVAPPTPGKGESKGQGMERAAPAPYSAAGLCPGCGRAVAACRCAVQCYSPYDLALLPVLLELAGAAQQRQKEQEQQAGARGAAAPSDAAPYPGYSGNTSTGSLFLASLVLTPTWSMDVNHAMLGDATVVAGWSDASACSAWEGTSAFGGSGAAPCGSGAGGCGSGGGGSGVCGGAGAGAFGGAAACGGGCGGGCGG